MMKYLTILIVASIFSVTLLGLVSMNHDTNHMKTTCVNFALNGTDCPVNGFAFILHHIEAQRTLFNTNAAQPLSSFLLILFAITTLITSRSILKGSRVPELQRLLEYSRIRRKDSYIKSRTIVPWLALLEHSPSF